MEQGGLPLVLHRNKKGKNVLSELHDPDRAGKGILSFLNAQTASALRGTSAFARNSVTEGYLGSKEVVIRGPIAQWRAANPNAIYANISGRKDLTDEDFVYLRGVKYLNMSRCDQASITDNAFAHLRGIHTLYMRGCNQEGITDKAFAHLRGIHTLWMCNCSQAGITDNAFAHLRGIHTLDMRRCNQAGITDAAFAHLRGIHTLEMSGCDQPGITDNAFSHLRGIRTLKISWCNQVGITDNAFAHLRGIRTLDMSCCSQAGITDNAFTHLRGIQTLDMGDCDQAGITGETLYMLGDNLQQLYIGYCNDDTIRNANIFFGVTPMSSSVTRHIRPVDEEKNAVVGKNQQALSGSGLGTWGGRRTRGLRIKRKSKKTRTYRYTRKTRVRR